MEGLNFSGSPVDHFSDEDGVTVGAFKDRRGSWNTRSLATLEQTQSPPAYLACGSRDSSPRSSQAWAKNNVEVNCSEQQAQSADGRINDNHYTNATLDEELSGRQAFANPEVICQKINDDAIRFCEAQQEKPELMANGKFKKIRRRPKSPLEFFRFFLASKYGLSIGNLTQREEKYLFKFYLVGMFKMDKSKSAKVAKRTLNDLVQCFKSLHEASIKFNLPVFEFLLDRDSLDIIMNRISDDWDNTNLETCAEDPMVQLGYEYDAFKPSVQVYSNGKYTEKTDSDLLFFLDKFPDIEFSIIDILPSVEEVQRISCRLEKKYHHVEMCACIANAKNDTAYFGDFEINKIFKNKCCGARFSYDNQFLDNENILVVLFKASLEKNIGFSVDCRSIPELFLLPENYPIGFTLEVNCLCLPSPCELELVSPQNCLYSVTHRCHDPSSEVRGIQCSSFKLRSFDFSIKRCQWRLPCNIF